TLVLHPHCAAAAATPAQAAVALCGRQPHCQGAATPTTGAAAPVGGRAGRERQPLASWPLPIGPSGLTVAGRPCGLAAVGRARRWPPLAGGLAVAGSPLQVARPWSAALVGGLTVASHLCMQTTCMWPPLPHRQRLLSLQQARRTVLRDSISSHAV
ncbi:hypothetical protein BHM03_00015630, partial [Ensete ventricosum]